MLINMCRICARSNICDRSVNLFDKANCKVLRHIQMLTGLQLINSGDVPAFICFCCQSDLRVAMSFRKLCIKTQKRWQDSVKFDRNHSESDSESPEQHILISNHTTQVQEQEQKNITPQQTLQIMLQEVTSNTFTLDDEQEQDRLDVNYDESNQHKESKTKAVIARRPRKIYEKSKSKLQVYICELCGTHVNTKASFERHIRKHTGERPFACELCESRFLSAGELKGHQVMHTGDRNYPCRYCDRKYVSYMGRKKHEMSAHTNERPFVCDECGKTFTNSYVLKNHMLVHTGERLFRCDLCERSFQRKTHLRTHFQSNMHRQNVDKQTPVLPANLCA